MSSSDCQGRYFQVAATALGKGEVHSSILCGSTTSGTVVGTENRSKVGHFLNACACGVCAFHLPSSTGTDRETLARVTRIWHATRTPAAATEVAAIAEVTR